LEVHVFSDTLVDFVIEMAFAELKSLSLLPCAGSCSIY